MKKHAMRMVVAFLTLITGSGFVFAESHANKTIIDFDKTPTGQLPPGSNAVVLIKGAPHPDNARKLVDYLLTKEAERKLAFAAGLPLDILLGKTDLPFRRFFTVLFSIPLLIPPYITAISWFYILGREGVASRLLGTSPPGTTSAWLFGLQGCVLVLFSTFLPIVMLLTITYLKTINPRLEEAGRLVSGWPGVLKNITIPLALPGILLAMMLVFLLGLGEFSVPAFLRYNVFPVESFTQFSTFLNFGAATDRDQIGNQVIWRTASPA